MAVTSIGDVTDHISTCQELEDVQRLELLNTLKKFSSLLSSLPGLAEVKGYNLKPKPDLTPKKMHPYRIPVALQQEVDRQINELLHLKLIEPSEILPLTELKKNRVPNIIPWNEAAHQAFTKLKAQLVKAPSLYTPNLSKPYQLYTDASATAIGACLSQNNEKGKENPIVFFSKKLAETQTRWATIEREAYAVIEVLKRFDSWIFGAEIEVISDHNPLTYLTLTTPQSAKLTRWTLALQRYNIAISYRKGVKHGNADPLSRLPIPVS
ncbi:retrovirus-related Pol polyprotein from transposon opus [Trichonephila clavipes]|nr:retrovirus-related Pol polyprotein from transposon opus [Trichonephila clavipes]